MRQQSAGLWIVVAVTAADATARLDRYRPSAALFLDSPAGGTHDIPSE